MFDSFSNSDDEEILTRLKRQQQGNQEMQNNLDSENLMKIFLNPQNMKISKTQLVSKLNKLRINLSEERSGTLIDENGTTRELTLNSIELLDDGTAYKQDCSVVLCGTCGGVIQESSMHRCPCGQVCCEIQGCGKVDVNGKWYCSNLHKFLHTFFGLTLR